ncbi:MAG: protein kinase [Planctomycetota bacterium]
MKILIADDNVVWRNLIDATAKQWGYRPIVVENGVEALEVLHGSDPPRLALLDWVMPELEGVEVCRRIKQDPSRPFTYIVLLTSRDDEEDMIQGLDAGADDYLTKPIQAPLLKSRLAAAKRIIGAVPPADWTKPSIDGFDVQHVIGKGAFATVWRAVHLATDRPTALKIIRADLATDLVFQRFRREIQTMRQMNHPGIAAIYASHLERELAYYAMELVDGQTLGHHISSAKPKATRVIEMMAQICDALQHAHDRGIIHRDVKPSNVMVTDLGQPKLVDFGLSKSMFQPKDSESSTSTVAGSVLGTPLFMSPEQARGEDDRVDHRSDLYAVATMLYLFLLRRHPHGAGSQGRDETIDTIATTPVTKPTSISAKFNAELEGILLKSLAANPEDRYVSAGDFAGVLRRFLTDRAAARSGIQTS